MFSWDVNYRVRCDDVDYKGDNVIGKENNKVMYEGFMSGR